jgi:hypothetical protein
VSIEYSGEDADESVKTNLEQAKFGCSEEMSPHDLLLDFFP